MLSETFLDRPSYIFTRLTRKRSTLKELRRRAFRLATIYSLDNYYYDILSRFVHLIDDNLDFVDLLANFVFDLLPVKDILKLGIKREEEMKKLGDLIRNLDLSNKNQTMAFNNLEINEIYDKQIAQVTNLTLHRRSKLIYDMRSTSTLYYDIFLPFHDKNYVPTYTDCTSKWDLPSFSKY